MIDLEGEVAVRGPYAAQPLAIKVISVLAYLASIDLLIVVPVSAGAAVLGGVGTAATSRSGTYGPFVLLLGMLLIGAWINHGWLGWLSSGRMDAARRWLVFGIACGTSASASAIAIAFHAWPISFLCVAAFVPVALVAYWLVVKITQAVGGAT
jgi:hypothetical protein